MVTMPLGCGKSTHPMPVAAAQMGFSRCRVPDSVLDAAVSYAVLIQPGVCALVGQGEVAAVAQHMLMCAHRQGSGGTVFLQ